MLLQNGRKAILKHFWTFECHNLYTNRETPNTKSWENQAKYIKRVKNIPDFVRDSVLEKWLTFAKSENLTEFMMWRLLIMKRKFTPPE